MLGKRIPLILLSTLLLLGFASMVQADVNDIVISQAGENYGAVTANDWIELYNPTSEAINLNGTSIQRCTGNPGTVTRLNLGAADEIPAYGFFLWADDGATDPGGDYAPLRTRADKLVNLYFNDDNMVAFVSNQVNITGGSDTDIIDRLAIGANTGYEGTGAATPDILADRAYERKALSSSDTTADLLSGGDLEFIGNGYDSNDNSVDFFRFDIHVNSDPQGTGQSTETLTFSVSAPGTVTVDVAFDLVMTAKDSASTPATVESYTGTSSLTVSSGTILPTTTSAFVSGTRTESVTISGTSGIVTITVTDGFFTGSTTTDVTTGGGNTAPVVSISSVAQRTDGNGHIEINFTGTDAENDDCNWVATNCEYSIDPYSTWTDITFDTADPAHTAAEPMAFTSTGASFKAVVDASAWTSGSYKVRLKVNDGALDSTQVTSNAFTVDNTAPSISAAQTDDTDSDGYIDQITLTYNETVTTNYDGFSIATTASGNTLTISTGSGSGSATIVLAATSNEVGSTDTEDTPNVTYTAASGDVTDSYGNTAADQTFTGTTDGAAPHMDSAQTKSSTRIDVTFSEDLNGVYVGAGDFTVTSPSLTVSAAEETSPGVVTLTVSTMDTDAIPTVAITGGQDVKDLALNACTSGSVGATDGAPPEMSSAVASDGTNAVSGIDDDDTVTITFTEDTNGPTINASNIDTVLALSDSHTWKDGSGAIGSAVWSTVTKTNDTLTITLSTATSDPTVAVGDTITLDGSTITDGTTASSDSYAITGTFSPGATHDIVINEFVSESSPSQYDGAIEWVELYNAGTSAISINGWKLYDESNDLLHTFADVTLNPGDYYVVYEDSWTGTDDNIMSDGLGQVNGSSWNLSDLVNTGDSLKLYTSSTRDSTTIVDFVAYDDGGVNEASAPATEAYTAGIWYFPDPSHVALDTVVAGSLEHDPVYLYRDGYTANENISSFADDWESHASDPAEATPGAPNLPPTAVTSVAFKNEAFDSDVTTADLGDNLYIELIGMDADTSHRNTCLVKLTSTSVESTGVRITLTETGVNTGIYRSLTGTGAASVNSATSYATDTVGAAGGDTVTVTSIDDGTKTDTLTTSGGETKISITKWRELY